MTDHTIEVRRRVAVQKCWCPKCEALPTARCVSTTDGHEKFLPHEERLTLADLWFAAYDQGVALIGRTRAELEASQILAATLQREKNDLDQRLLAAQDDLTNFKRENGVLTQKVADLEALVSWQSAVNGGADAWFDDLMKKLAAFGGLVWIAIHHEPEGDGDPALWKALQDRLSRRVPGGIAGNIKFWLVVTGYGQEHNVKGKTWDDLYPVGAPIYGIGYDNPYLDYGFTWSGGVKTTTMNSGWQEGSVYINQLAARAKKYGVKAAIGEMGYSDEAFAKDREWLGRAYGAAEAAGLLAVCYFDTPLNSKRSWYLDRVPAKRAYYNQITAQFNA